MWFNLINLMFWEKFEFLGLENTRIEDFVQLGLIWWNWLAGLIHMIIILCYLSWLMINWSIPWKLYKCFLKFWGFWYKLYAQADFVILKLNWIYSHCIRACIICLFYSCIILNYYFFHINSMLKPWYQLSLLYPFF